MTQIEIIPWNTDTSAVTNYTLKFTTASSLPSDGKILINFPIGFNLSSTTFHSWSDFDGGISFNISSQIIEITRDGTGTLTSPGAKYVVISGVENNAESNTTYNVSVETQYSDGTSIDGPTVSSNYSITSSDDILNPHSPWPVHGHDNRNSFHTSNIGPNYPALYWKYSFENGGNTHRGVLQDADGIIYAISNDTFYAFYSNGNLKYSFLTGESKLMGAALLANGTITVAYQSNGIVKNYRTSDGQLIWSYTTGISGDTTSVNVGPDGTFYISTRDAGTMALNSNGTRKFYMPTVLGRDTWPAIDNETGEIYLSDDGHEHAIYPGGIIKWKVERTNSVGNAPVLTKDGTKVFISGRGVGDYPTVCLDSTDGSLLWSIPNSSDGYSAPSLSSDESVLYTTKSTGELTARNPNTGEALWMSNYDNVDWINNIASDGDDNIYSGTYAFDSNGNTKWSLSGFRGSFPTIGSSNTLIYTNNAGEIYAIRPWTLSAHSDSTSYKPGETLEIVANTSMLKNHPDNPVEDNQVQVVFSDQHKVLLNYSSSNYQGTTWTGSYIIPTETIDGGKVARVEASQYNVETDIPTNFDTPSTGSNNSGIVSTFNYTVDTAAQEPVIKKIGSKDIVETTDTIYYNSNAVLISGTTEENSQVFFKLNGKQYSTNSNSSGNFSIQLQLTDGLYEIEYYSVDSLENESNHKYITLNIDTHIQIPTITKLGLITNIPQEDNITYYFYTNRLNISGTAEPNSKVTFKSDDITYNIKTDSNGIFTFQTNDPVLNKGSNEFEYYQTDLANNVSSSKTLTLVIGQEHFPTWLLEKLGLIESEVEEEIIEDTKEEEEIDEEIVEEVNEDQEETNTPPVVSRRKIKFTDKRGRVLAQANVEIEGNTYVTDDNGQIEIENLENRKYTAKIKTKDGKEYSMDILGVGDENGNIVIEIEDESDIDWIKILTYGGIALVVLVIGGVLVTGKRKNVS